MSSAEDEALVDAYRDAVRACAHSLGSRFGGYEAADRRDEARAALLKRLEDQRASAFEEVRTCLAKRLDACFCVEEESDPCASCMEVARIMGDVAALSGSHERPS